MSLPKVERIYTVDEYLAMERKADTRHEFIDGIIYAMAGESPAHSIISINISREFSTQLLGTPCITFSPNMKVRAGEAGLFAYPDLTIVCGEPQFHDNRGDVIINPTVIVEILSPSTEAYDRGQKFLKYRSNNASLMDYILIAQGIPLIDHCTRQSDGKWTVESITGLDGYLDVVSIGCHIATNRIYDRIVFPPAASPVNVV